MAEQEPIPKSAEVVAEERRRELGSKLARKREVLGSLPLVEHMLELQKTGMLIAKSQQKLRPSKRKSNASFFMPKGLDGYVLYEGEDQEAGPPDDRYWMHRFTGRVGRTGHRDRQWSMKIVESLGMSEDKSGFQDWIRINYRFTWTSGGVLSAMKNIHCVAHPTLEAETTAAVSESAGGKASAMQIAQAKTMNGDDKSIAVFGDAGSTTVVVMPTYEQQPSTEPYSPAMVQAIDSSQVLTGGDCERLAGAMRQFGRSSAEIYGHGLNARSWIAHDYLPNYDQYER